MLSEAQALLSFSALSQPTRLRILRHLVVAGEAGLAAGAIGAALGDASSSRLSFHLAQLEQAGLVTAQRQGRSIIYRAHYPALSGLLTFLMRDCCQNHPAVCGPLADMPPAPCQGECS